MNLRACVARVVAAVSGKGQALDTPLHAACTGLSGLDAALVKELSYGTLRHWYYLIEIVQRLLHKPFKRRDQDLQALLCAALYALLESRIPARATIFESVAATRDLKKSWAAPVLNAALRRFLRNRDQLSAVHTETAAYAAPQWWLQAVKTDWPDAWTNLLSASNQRPPLWLRVNRQRYTADEYQALLQAQGLTAHCVPAVPQALRLEQAVSVDRLPQFAAGAVSVQDAAAQLAADLLQAPAAGRVLDACVAPGGKCCHLAELDPTLDILGLDVDAQRLQAAAANCARLGLDIELRHADARAPQTWWDGRPFDRILLDAPCSGTGVVRRHPDIKLLRRAADIGQFAAQQTELLERLWPLVKPGGMLLYVSCSIAKRENTDVVSRFIDSHRDVEPSPVALPWGVADSIGGRQILTGEAEMDGFYYARIHRTARTHV